ncbi:MAG: radical SAM protein [Methanobacteriaceae archaeon]|nr:radical SAM protein [Methanobacteriaceae archaeon]
MLDEISLEITYNCCQKCIFCSSSAASPSPLKNELSTDEIKKLLYDCAVSSQRPKNFSISGGEPLMHKDIYEVMKYANDLGYTNLLYTTGQTMEKEDELKSITKEDARKLSQMNVKVIFDLQDISAPIHDKIMDRNGSFDRTIEAIKLLKEQNVWVESHFVPNTLNFRHFLDYFEFTKDLSLDRISFLRLVQQGRAHDNPYLELSKKQFKELQYLFLRVEEEKDIPFRLGHPIDRRFLISPKYKIPVCRGATDAPLITPIGDVYVCPAWKNLEHYKSDNIRNTPLEKIMNENKYYKIFYDFIHKDGWKNIVGKCQSCNYLSKCRGGCVAQRLLFNSNNKIPLEQAITLGSDPLCWYGD